MFIFSQEKLPRSSFCSLKKIIENKLKNQIVLKNINRKAKKTSYVIYRNVNVGKDIVGGDKQKITKHIHCKNVNIFT